ncbi:MAG: alpha/beta hydrolase [Oscillospiraceae bacterium]|nr:alpha/beta hydrolase [Oscillospiraceae bacterium]
MYEKKIIIISSVFLFIIFIFGILIGNYFYNLAINSKTDKSKIFNANHNLSEDYDEAKTSEIMDAYSILQKQEIYLSSFDNLKLHASFVKNEASDHKWVILCHGYAGVNVILSKVALKFYNINFNILIPDLRSFGKSEGNYLGMGWHDRLDIVSWIQKILEIDSAAQIVLYGQSMGGAAVMAASGENLPDNVKAIAEDSGYSSLWEEFSYQLKELYGLPSFPFLNFASMMTSFKAQYNLKEVDLVKQVAKSKTPMLFIHGEKDTFVPMSHVEKVYEAANVPKEKLIVENAKHTRGIIADESLYWNTMEKFLQLYLRGI